MPDPPTASSTHRAKFIPARDSRNRRVPGLYLRGDRYYAQLWVDVGNGKKTSRRFPLRDGANQPVRTLSDAREALEVKRHERRENQLPTIGHKPVFPITVPSILKRRSYNENVPGRSLASGRPLRGGAII